MTKFDKLQEGSILGEQTYYKVLRINGLIASLQTDTGDIVEINSHYIESCIDSADQFDSTVKVTRTEMIDVFMKGARKVMTVIFLKQVKEDDVVAELMKTYKNTPPAKVQDEFSKAVTRAMVGESRTIRGRHYGLMNEHGRVHFVDMEIEKDPSKEYDVRMRQVDPRTIQMLVVDDIKYTLK